MAGKRHEKRSIAWDKDLAILKRLNLVADMLNQGRQLHIIAEALGVSLTTANRDAKRVRELWRRAAMQSIDDKRAVSKAKYEFMQKQAFDEYRQARQEGKSGIAALRLAMEIEEKINRLEGTAVTHVDITSKGESLAEPRELTDDELVGLLSASSPERQ
jgi:hypothetical protein